MLQQRCIRVDGRKVVVEADLDAHAPMRDGEHRVQVHGSGATVVPHFDDKEDGWTLRIERRHHGNVRVSTLDAHFLVSADYRTLADIDFSDIVV